MAAGTPPEPVLGDRPDDLVDERGRRERPVEDQGPAVKRGQLERGRDFLERDPKLAKALHAAGRTADAVGLLDVVCPLLDDVGECTQWRDHLQSQL